MNSKKIKWILYVIILVIISTISIQVYWNYKNYQTNKQQLINDVQVSLDNAVDSYFESLAKDETHSFFMQSNQEIDLLCQPMELGTLINSFRDSALLRSPDSLNTNRNGIQIFEGSSLDKMSATFRYSDTAFRPDSLQSTMNWGNIRDSLDNRFELLTSKVVFSITNDSLELKRIDSLLKLELQRKNLNLDYGLSFEDPMNGKQFFNTKAIHSKALKTSSKSMFLPGSSALNVYFNNETKIILKRILSGILISILLVLVVISCLVYMLKIINHQKELAEVKNDLISNITHEFKTPIATISVALEGIKNFNVIDDKVKTKSYLDLSTNQLSKLTIMVEKLLETATLDSDNLELNLDTTDLTNLLHLQVEKHKMQLKDKTLTFKASAENVISKIDVFHFENAVNNVIDNAVKYGGDTISVNLIEKNNTIDISVTDNGNTLTQANVNQIFEKFYRVPKGNTHDIKGFGIGLYYTKKIIEKHNGTISINLKKGTTFIISIPKV